MISRCEGDEIAPHSPSNLAIASGLIPTAGQLPSFVPHRCSVTPSPKPQWNDEPQSFVATLQETAI